MTVPALRLEHYIVGLIAFPVAHILVGGIARVVAPEIPRDMFSPPIPSWPFWVIVGVLVVQFVYSCFILETGSKHGHVCLAVFAVSLAAVVSLGTAFVGKCMAGLFWI